MLRLFHRSLSNNKDSFIKHLDPVEPIDSKLKAVGTPQEISQKRNVLIFKPSKTAMQSGRAQTKHWVVQFDTVAKWEYPLIGWTSSNDPVQGLVMKFSSKEAAIRYAEEQGLNFRIKEPSEAAIQPKSYASNFLYSKDKLKIIKTK